MEGSGMESTHLVDVGADPNADVYAGHFRGGSELPDGRREASCHMADPLHQTVAGGHAQDSSRPGMPRADNPSQVSWSAGQPVSRSAGRLTQTDKMKYLGRTPPPIPRR